MLYSSCLGEFVPDPINPELTVYSADGKNTASALINGKAWNDIGYCGFYDCETLRLRNDISNNKIRISFESGYMVQTKEPVSLHYELLGLNINSISDIPSLKGKDFSLTNDPNFATINYSECKSTQGKLFIREVVETNNGNFIIAGTFGFIITVENGETYEVFKGRFDSYILYYEE